MPVIYSIIVIDPDDSKTHIDLDEKGDGLLLALVVFFWPISFALQGWDQVSQARAKLIREQAMSVIDEWDINKKHKFERSDTIRIPESDLKILIKAYRLKLITLDTSYVEIIREELLSRNMERNLLK